jgi:hypothetical protein
MASIAALQESFLKRPLYAFEPAMGFATVYSAVFRPALGSAEYFWPGKSWRQSFDAFSEGSYTHRYTAPT